MTDTDEAAALPTGGSARSKRVSRPFTDRQRAQIAVIVLAGLALVIPFSDAPTGSPFVDDVLGGLAFVAVVLAASRARRWSLVVASAGALLLGGGTLHLIAVGLAFVASVAMTHLSHQRDRVVGAAIGCGLAVGLFGVSVEWFAGSSTLVALGLVAPVLISGFLNSRSSARRVTRRAVLGAAAVIVVGGAAGGVSVLQARAQLGTAVQETTDGVDLLRKDDLDGAARLFASASRRFDSSAGRLGSWWTAPTRVVPVVSQNVRLLENAARAGSELTAVASSLARQVDYEKLFREGGGIDLAALASFRAPIGAASDRMEASQRRLERLSSPWILPTLDRRLDDLLERLADLRDEAGMARMGIRLGPDLLGARGTRRYLALLGNPAELRDLGGHIGNWAELEVTDGVMDLREVGSPLDLANPGADTLLQEDELTVPQSFFALQPAAFPQNWGGSRDTDTVARLAASLFELKTGREIDGVIYADPSAMSAMLALTGPIPIPNLDADLTQETAVRFLTRDQFTAFGDQQTGDESVRSLVRELFDRFTATSLPGPRRLADLFHPVTTDGRLRFTSLHPDDRPLLRRLNLDVPLEAAAGGDVLAVVNRNTNPSKIDVFLHRSSRYSVQWDPNTGGVSASVTVRLRNSAPTSGLPDLVIGNDHGLGKGVNRTDLAVLTGLDLVGVSIEGKDAAVSPTTESGRNRYDVRVIVPPGEERIVRFRLAGFVAPGGRYHLTVGGQPLATPTSVRATIRSRQRDVTIAGPAVRNGELIVQGGETQSVMALAR